MNGRILSCKRSREGRVRASKHSFVSTNTLRSTTLSGTRSWDMRTCSTGNEAGVHDALPSQVAPFVAEAHGVFDVGRPPGVWIRPRRRTSTGCHRRARHADGGVVLLLLPIGS